MNRAFRNTTNALVAAGLLLGGLAACSPSNEEALPRTDALAQAANASAAATPSTNPGAPGPVIGRATTSATLKANYRRINDLFTAPEVDATVIGVITDVQYRTVEGMAKTLLTVSVKRSRPKNLPATIEVWEDGGYVRASDLAKQDADKFPQAEAGTEDGWVEFVFEGAEHPKVGQAVLLFLNKNPNPGYESSYQEVGSVFGRFVQQDGVYTRTPRGEDARGDAWEKSISRSAVDARFADGQ
jgi:hypothetical protein